MAKHLSPNMEMYLKTILRLGRDGSPVRVKAIADSMGVTMPSVSGALQQLKLKGLVLHPSYGAVRLTSRGRRAAGAINQRYEVLQQFFAEVLDLDPRTSDRDACEIEHVVSAKTLDRLTAFMDYITRCRMDVREVINHFHEYLALRTHGDPCPDCELGHQSNRPAMIEV